MTTRLAVFDCDGTLVDSEANIGTAMDVCFAEAGLAAPSRAQTRRMVGLSLFEAMQTLHPAGDDALHKRLADDYKRCFQRLRAEGAVDEPLFDGIAAAIDTLGRDGWVLGIATGKSDRGLELALAGHGLLTRFATLHTADHHPSKPHPAMLVQAMRDVGATAADTVMIGDTSYDIRMAHAAGVRAIGVAWGYHAADELIAAGADAVAEHPDELARLCAAAVA